MTTLKTHRNLDVWNLSMDFIMDLYRITNSFPATEKFGLTSQLRRAGISVSSNIAEGAAHHYPREFQQFLYISLGSVSEIETQLEIALRLGYMTSIDKEMDVVHRLRKMLVRLIEVIRRKIVTRDA